MPEKQPKSLHKGILSDVNNVCVSDYSQLEGIIENYHFEKQALFRQKRSQIFTENLSNSNNFILPIL